MNRFLSFVRLVDEQQNLSLTNAALYSTLLNLLGNQGKSLTDVAAFAIAVLGYCWKRYISYKTPKQPEVHPVAAEINELREQLEEQKNKLSSISVAVGMKQQIARRP